MASKITITDTKNRITIIPSSSNKVETSITNTPVTVTQNSTNKVEIFNTARLGSSITTTNITASGDISSSGIVTADSLSVTDITASGNISASGDITASQMLLERSGSVNLTLNSTQNGQPSRIDLREDGNQFGAYMMYDSSDFHIGSINAGADTDSIIIARGGDITFRHNVEIGNQKTLTVLLDNDRTTPSFTVQDENTSDSVFSISGDGSGNPIANLVLTGSANIVGNISASGDIFATSMSLGHVTNPLGQLHIADNGTEVGSNSFIVKIPDNSIRVGTQGSFFTDLKFGTSAELEVIDTGNTDKVSFRASLKEGGRIETNKIRSGNGINDLTYSALDFESSLYGITTVDPAFTFKTFTDAGSLNRSRLEMYNGDSGAVILQPSHSSGNVGIGTNSTPGEKLTVSGNISASGDITTKNANHSGSFIHSGSFTVYGGLGAEVTGSPVETSTFFGDVDIRNVGTSENLESGPPRTLRIWSYNSSSIIFKNLSVWSETHHTNGFG